MIGDFYLRLVGSALCVALLVGCRPQEAETRFIVDVTIEDNGTELKQNAIWQARVFKPLLPLDYPYGFQTDTEAIPFHLADGSWLFVTPNGGQPLWPEKRFHRVYRPKDDDRVEMALKIGRMKGWRFKIDCSYNRESIPSSAKKERCPLILIAANLKDPESFKILDIEHFPQNDGHRIKLKSIYVTITDQPPSDRLDRLIPWLRAYRTRPLTREIRSSGPKGFSEIPPLWALKTKH